MRFGKFSFFSGYMCSVAALSLYALVHGGLPFIESLRWGGLGLLTSFGALADRVQNR